MSMNWSTWWTTIRKLDVLIRKDSSPQLSRVTATIYGSSQPTFSSLPNHSNCVTKLTRLPVSQKCLYAKWATSTLPLTGRAVHASKYFLRKQMPVDTLSYWLRFVPVTTLPQWDGNTLFSAITDAMKDNTNTDDIIKLYKMNVLYIIYLSLLHCHLLKKNTDTADDDRLNLIKKMRDQLDAILN